MNRTTRTALIITAAVAAIGLTVWPAAAADPTDPRLATAQANVTAYCTALVDDAQNASQRSTRADLCAMWTREVADLAPTTPTTTPPPSPPSTTPPVPTTAPPTPTPSPTQPPTSGWPGAGNSGVPPATSLTIYTGPCTITVPTTITAKIVNCQPLAIRAATTINQSKVNGQVFEDYVDSASVTVMDSEVDAGQVMGAAVSNTNVTVLRSNIHGGAASVQCGSNCIVRDSWLHGQYRPSGSDWHLDGFITNGGSHMELTHNTLACDEMTGGCTANGFLAADFAKVVDVKFINNLFVASTQVQYCTYGGSNRLGSAQIVYQDNVFQRGQTGKCGKYGAYIYIDGATWTNNRWDDGTLM